MPISYIVSCILVSIIAYPAGSLFYPQVIVGVSFLYIYFDSKKLRRIENDSCDKTNAYIFIFYAFVAIILSVLPIYFSHQFDSAALFLGGISKFSEYLVDYTVFVNRGLRVEESRHLYLWTVFSYVLPITIACSNKHMIRCIGFYMFVRSPKSLFSVKDKIRALVGLSFMFILLDWYFKLTNVYMGLQEHHWLGGIVMNFMRKNTFGLAMNSLFTMAEVLFILSMLFSIPHYLRTKDL